jgi:succinate-semialdehyde dehydrogenase / glutarate-semialdehyde dehydrogenase
MVEAGVPDGVMNVLPGSHSSVISTRLMADPRLRKVSFTGSTAVGKTLLKMAADNVLRTSMELGGNAPFLVFADADLDAAVEGAVAAKMRNIGEACTAANRFLVEETVADEFAAKLAARLGGLRVGNGVADGVNVGPLVEGKARDKVSELVGDALSRGGRALVGGHSVDGPGYFYEPTVLIGMGTDADVFTEEIFGPVAPIFTFKGEDEAVRLANDTEYGLASYVYTSDLKRAHRIGDRLDFGLLGLNAGVISNAAAPFGGVKQSGLGREGGAEGIAEYTTIQYMGMANPWA